jgi:hypothetical protein
MKAMKSIVLCIASLVLSLSACAQKPADTNQPVAKSAKLDTTLPWLQIKIWDYQSEPVSNPPRSVIKTTFEGKPVYYVPPVCCDIPSELYAEDGRLICYPNGGFTGAGDGKCPKFKDEYADSLNVKKDHKTVVKTTVVWKDTRQPAADTNKASKSDRVIPNLQ